MAGQEPVTVAVPSRRQILALALPALGTLAADPILSLADTAFVGRLGAVELAALGVDTAIFSFAFALFNFLAYATTPLVAQAVGAGNQARAGAVVRQALRLAVLIGVGAAIVLIAGAPLFVRLMQAGPAVVDPAVSYLQLRAFAVPALLIITAANGAYRGVQDTRTPFVVVVAVNLVNIALDPILIFGAGLGIEGAAIATVVAQWAGAGAFLILLRRLGRERGWEGTAEVRMKAFLGLSSLIVVRTLLLVSSLALGTAVAARVGTIEVAAHQVVSQLWFLLAMSVDAIAIAAQAMVADLVGRGAKEQARMLSDRLLWWGLWTGVALGALLFILQGPLAAIFTNDPVVIAAIVSVIPIAAVMQPLAAVLFVADGIFLAVLALRRIVASTAAGFLATVIVLAGVIEFGWGLVGVWWAVVAMVAGRALVLGLGYPGAVTRSSS